MPTTTKTTINPLLLPGSWFGMSGGVGNGLGFTGQLTQESSSMMSDPPLIWTEES